MRSHACACIHFARSFVFSHLGILHTQLEEELDWTNGNPFDISFDTPWVLVENIWICVNYKTRMLFPPHLSPILHWRNWEPRFPSRTIEAEVSEKKQKTWSYPQHWMDNDNSEISMCKMS